MFSGRNVMTAVFSGSLLSITDSAKMMMECHVTNRDPGSCIYGGHWPYRHENPLRVISSPHLSDKVVPTSPWLICLQSYASDVLECYLWQEAILPFIQFHGIVISIHEASASCILPILPVCSWRKLHFATEQCALNVGIKYVPFTRIHCHTLHECPISWNS